MPSNPPREFLEKFSGKAPRERVSLLRATKRYNVGLVRALEDCENNIVKLRERQYYEKYARISILRSNININNHTIQARYFVIFVSAISLQYRVLYFACRNHISIFLVDIRRLLSAIIPEL